MTDPKEKPAANPTTVAIVSAVATAVIALASYFGFDLCPKCPPCAQAPAASSTASE